VNSRSPTIRASTLQLPKQPQRLLRGVLTKTEASRLIEATPTTKPRDIRDRAILETLYATGIRRAELIALTIYDADLQATTLRIEHGKGTRSVGSPSRAARLLP
jgi:integrase/recombinase XerD